MEPTSSMLKEYKIAGQILILWVLFDYLEAINGFERHATGNIPPFQSQIYMIRPKDSSLRDGSFYEF